MPDRAVLFIGPTLDADSVSAVFGAGLRPPAARGDVYRAALEEPHAILIVDGAFENVPALFHKEILWALHAGIHVFGAASIGALRAAELHTFGMVGIGEIFEAYRDGRLRRDDAVAVLHGPADLGWPQLTRALVDMEATFVEAERQGVLQAEARVALQACAADLFWRERTYRRVVEQALSSGWTEGEADLFLDWVTDGEVSQKGRDALALLNHVATHWQALEEPFQPSFRFESTAAWQALRSEIEGNGAVSPAEFRQIETALRRNGLYEAIEAEALLMLLAEQASCELEGSAAPEAFQEAAYRFRRQRGLGRAEDVARWMAANGFTHSDYLALVHDQEMIEGVRNRFSSRLPQALLRVLRRRGISQASLTGSGAAGNA